MFDTSNSINRANLHIANGMAVYDANGDKVGTVRNFDPQDGYLDVHKGLLITKDFFVPVEAVEKTEQDAVYVRLSKEALSSGSYNQPPARPVGTSMGSDIPAAGVVPGGLATGMPAEQDGADVGSRKGLSGNRYVQNADVSQTGKGTITDEPQWDEAPVRQELAGRQRAGVPGNRTPAETLDESMPR